MPKLATRRLFLALMLAAGAASGAEHWDREAARRVADQPAGDAEVARLIQAALWQPAPVVAEEIRAILEHDDRPAPLRERILFDFVRGLRELPVQPQLIGLLEGLAAHEAVALVPHAESATYHVPLFNVAAAAAGTLNGWAAQAMRDRAAFALGEGDATFFAGLAKRALANPELAGLAQALSGADAGELRMAWPGLAQLLAERPEAAHLVEAPTRALGDTRALEVVAEHGTAVPVIARADTLVDLATAQAFWRDLLVAGRSPARGAALVRLAETGALTTQKSRGDLVRLLGGETGADAALALGRAGQVELLAGLALDRDQPPVIRRRAALGLRLEGSAAAHAALERLHQSGAADPMAAEVAPWLE